MTNEERDQLLYRYPNSNVLRNKFGITDHALLENIELAHVTQRTKIGMPKGNFDLQHLQGIHRHLFQDVYDWAGDIRKVDFGKGGNWFHPFGRIEMGMADVQKRLAGEQYLRGLDRSDFAKRAGEYIGDVNRAHPFREGNGRTQFQYLKQLGEQAGHQIDLSRFEQASWIQASKEANQFHTERMASDIEQSIVEPQREQQSAREAYVREQMQKPSQDETQPEHGQSNEQGSGDR
ncbi:MAG: Fic family protein [Rhodobacteraceae bacterium]|nr:Fic family protein [Paracoccaceae bacterium]